MFVTIREFAKETGLSYPHIRQLIQENKLPHIKSGTRFLIPKTDAIAVLEKLAYQPTQQ